mgnify:CR=1 FL=1
MRLEAKGKERAGKMNTSMKQSILTARVKKERSPEAKGKEWAGKMTTKQIILRPEAKGKERAVKGECIPI